MASNYEIDKLDLQILSMLMQNAQTPYTEIAKRLEVSGGTVHVRMKKLQAMEVVKGAHLDIDATLLGYDICAFVGMFLDKGDKYNNIVEKLKEIPEITEIHFTTGMYSIFLKIMSHNTRELRKILNDKVQTIDGVQRTETFISLEESLKRPIKILRPEELSKMK
ncbi:MAG: Lrp/AsnC ligand binding domain-containing protein [Bacteroidota bacterium]